jgi:hypothetical protein
MTPPNPLRHEVIRIYKRPSPTTQVPIPKPKTPNTISQNSYIWAANTPWATTTSARAYTKPSQPKPTFKTKPRSAKALSKLNTLGKVRETHLCSILCALADEICTEIEAL